MTKAVNGTDAKDIALHFIGAKELELTKTNIIKNIAIAKSILDLGYPKESILIAIDLNIEKMYSLGFIKFVIEEVHIAIMAKAKEDEIKEALSRINTKKTFVESEGDGTNRNKQKLERKSNLSRLGKSYPDDLFKQ